MIPAGENSTQTGDTSTGFNNGDGSCQLGGAPDITYQIDITQDGVLDLSLDTTAHLGLHARFICIFPFAELDCADNGTAGPQHLAMEVYAGDSVTVFVDGHSAADKGPFKLDIAVHGAVCGDGVVQGNELCDPPDGVTCGPTCGAMPEVCDDLIDNDNDGLIDCEAGSCATDPACPNTTLCGGATTFTGSTSGDTTGGSAAFAGSCTGGYGAKEQVFTYTPAASGLLNLTLDSAADLGLYVRTGCLDDLSEIACADAVVGGSTEDLSVQVQAGVPLTIFVDGAYDTALGPFTLNAALLVLNEVEPNNTSSQATMYSSPYMGNISPGLDVDWISVTVPGPSSKITAEVADIGNGECASNAIDSEVEIYAPDGTTSLAYNDDDPPNYCSLVTATGLAAGTYFVRVSESKFAVSPGATFSYKLNIVVQ